MADFITNYKNYIAAMQKIPAQSGDFASNPNDFTDSANFIKNGILSIFDSPKTPLNTRFYDGIIDYKEFNSINQQEYKRKIKELKKFYKEKTGKELKYHIPTYFELEKMLKNDIEDFKSHKNGFSDPEKRKMKITAQEIIEPICPDGKIGQSNQMAAGECYQDATDIALSYTSEGQNMLFRSFKKYHDGYSITLFGAKDKNNVKTPKTYYISQKELKDAQEATIEQKISPQKTLKLKKYASGDADVVLYDLAIEKHRKETGYPLRYKDKKEVKGYDDYLSGGHFCKNLSLITGKNCQRYNFMIIDETSSEIQLAKNIENKGKRVMECLRKIEKEKQQILSGSSFICIDKNRKHFEELGLIQNHAFVVKAVDIKRRFVELSDPQLGKYINIKVPIVDFIKYVNYIDVLSTK